MPAAYAAAFRPIACGNTASYARLYRDVLSGRLCIRRAFFLLEDPNVVALTAAVASRMRTPL